MLSYEKKVQMCHYYFKRRKTSTRTNTLSKLAKAPFIKEVVLKSIYPK